MTGEVAQPITPFSQCGTIRAAVLFRAWAEACRWQREVDAILVRWQLSHSSYLVLDVADRLAKRGEFTQTRLARLIGIADSAVCRTVRVLLDRGLLDRDMNVDYTAWLIEVTEEGRTVLALTRPIVEALAVEFIQNGALLPLSATAASMTRGAAVDE